MSSKTTVRALTGAELDAWSDLVTASPDGSVYALPAYLDVLCTAAGGSFRVLGLYRGDELVGGLPLYERSSRAGAWAGPRLLLYYHGPVLRRSETRYPSQRTAREVDGLGALADGVAALGLDAVTLKCRHTMQDVRPFLARGWKAVPSYSYEVPIADLEQARARMEQNLRRLVDRCERQGFTMSESEDFDAFYRLHVQTLERRDVGAYLPEVAFQDYFTRLRAAGLCRLFHALEPGGAVAASQLVLTGPHPVSHTVSAAADPAHMASGVSAFLRWKAFEALSEAGGVANDLTDAALNPVTHFKSQLGGTLVLCMVLHSPPSRRWRRHDMLNRARRRVRGLARRLLRPGGEDG